MWRAALLLVVTVAACDGGAALPGAPLGWGPASNTLYGGGGDIVGDWFFCRDAECHELTDDGIRFAPDGDVSLLYADGGYEAGAGYCVYGPVARYQWDGRTATVAGVVFPDLSVTVSGDRATGTMSDESITLARVPAENALPCPVYADQGRGTVSR